MTPFHKHSGIVVPLDRENVDTDAILPKQYMKSVERTGFGRFLFDEWRYTDCGDLDTPTESRQPNPNFVLNYPRYHRATILLARENFGCGSSREHAPWALQQYGFKVLIATSFADIFYNNCLKNGLLPANLSATEIDKLFEEIRDAEGYSVTVDLESEQVITPSNTFRFSIKSADRLKLLTGMDEISETLSDSETIRAFEIKRLISRPWL